MPPPTRQMEILYPLETQLVSIMDALSKTAVMEISKLVEIESKMLKIEITRGRNEIASLTEKLHLMEKLLYIAQGGRQDAAVCSVARDGSGNGTVETVTRLAIKSETSWENISSSTEVNGSQVEEEAATELPDPPKAQPDLIVVKEELCEVASRDTKRDGATKNRTEVDTVTEESPAPVQCHKTIAECQQTMFADSFVTLRTQPSAAGPGRRETQWNQLTPEHTTLEVGKSLAQNIASQSQSVLRNIKIHNFRNSATKRFGCLQCGKSFRCFSQLEIHQRSHTGEKPFRCTLCGKRYAQKGHLYTHQRTHTGEKPYRCPICGKGFIQKCTLDMHQRTHTGEKPFVCVKCGKGFTKNCNLKKHLAVHLDANLSLYGNESSTSAFGGTFVNGTT